MTTPGSAIVLVRPDLVPRIRQHFQSDPSIAVFDASDAIPPLSIISPRAQMLLVVGHALTETTTGLEFLDRFREVNATAEIRVLAEGPNGNPTVLQHAVTHPAHLALRAESVPFTRAPVRRAPRVDMPEDAEAVINGVTARVINLSPLGAQVLSPHVLKPGEQVLVRLPRSPRVVATVVWSAYELHGAGREPCYRAGLQFS